MMIRNTDDRSAGIKPRHDIFVCLDDDILIRFLFERLRDFIRIKTDLPVRVLRIDQIIKKLLYFLLPDILFRRFSLSFLLRYLFCFFRERPL